MNNQLVGLSIQGLISVTLILFSVIDIIGSLPIVMELNERTKSVHPLKATLVSGFLMMAALFIGIYILHLLNLDVESFSLAGALIMFLMGLEMVLDVSIFKYNKDLHSYTIIPVAFPLISGPGTITTIISLRAEYSKTLILTSIFINLIFVFIALKQSEWISKKLGPSGINISRKFFGIILLAMAIKLVKNNL